MNRTRIVGAVEIGTDKVVALVAEVEDGNRLNLIGEGQSTTQGVKKGEIIDRSAVSISAHAALQAAEKRADATLETVYISISGGHLAGFRHSGVTSLSSREGVVTPVDLERAVDNAKTRALEPGRVYIQHAQTGVFLDGKPVSDALGRQGGHLEVHYWHVTADEAQVKHHLDVISGYEVELSDIVVSSIAAGSILATEEEKRQGVLVLDVGKGTSDFVVYRQGRVVLTGVIPVGGEHLTNDLAVGLRIKGKYAESLKKRSGCCLVRKADKGKKVPVVGDMMIGDAFVPQHSINQILHARLEELFIILQNKLGKLLSKQNLPCGVLLTGGVSKTSGICELGELILDVPVNLGHSPEWVKIDALREPEYTTVLGLMHNALMDQRAKAMDRSATGSGWFSRFTGGLFR